MAGHYLNPDLFKALEGGAPYFGGAASKPTMGPRGGKIKKVSPTTGKPIYYKKWGSDQGYNPHPVSNTDKGGYEAYHKGSVIGKTSNGLPIYAGSDVSNKYVNNTRNYLWRDHIDAHQAHFSLAQYIKNLIMKRLMEGGDTSKLHGRYNAHIDFSKHHYKQALLDLIHGKKESVSQEDLGKREEEHRFRRKSLTKGVPAPVTPRVKEAPLATKESPELKRIQESPEKIRTALRGLKTYKRDKGPAWGKPLPPEGKGFKGVGGVAAPDTPGFTPTPAPRGITHPGGKMVTGRLEKVPTFRRQEGEEGKEVRVGKQRGPTSTPPPPLTSFKGHHYLSDEKGKPLFPARDKSGGKLTGSGKFRWIARNAKKYGKLSTKEARAYPGSGNPPSTAKEKAFREKWERTAAGWGAGQRSRGRTPFDPWGQRPEIPDLAKELADYKGGRHPFSKQRFGEKKKGKHGSYSAVGKTGFQTPTPAGFKRWKKRYPQDFRRLRRWAKRNPERRKWFDEHGLKL